MRNNYLIDFAEKLDCLISEIYKLNSKIAFCKKNSDKFGFDFNVKFEISPKYFEELRVFIHKKIDLGSEYDKSIVDLKRDLFREYSYLVLRIKKEIIRINLLQEREMNKIVYKEIYEAKYQYEMKKANEYNIQSSLLDKFVGLAKYRNLMVKNHELKAKLIEKNFKKNQFERKTIFELISMIENADVKNGNLLCLQEDMIKSFMIDRNTIKRNIDYSWKLSTVLPYGFFAKKAHYKVLNREILLENDKLEKQLLENDNINEIENELHRNNRLFDLNEKLSKILKLGLALNQ